MRLTFQNVTYFSSHKILDHFSQFYNLRMDTQSQYFRVRRKDIAYFKFIIESHEGMAVIRTKDPQEAIVELMIAPGWEKDVEEVLEELRKEIPIEAIT